MEQLVQKKAIVPIIILKDEYLIKTTKMDSLQLKSFLVKLKKLGYNNSEIEKVKKIFNKGVMMHHLWYRHHNL